LPINEPQRTANSRKEWWAAWWANVPSTFAATVADRHGSAYVAIMPANQPINLHQVWSHEQPLGVECLGCKRRALLSAEQLGAHKDNMQAVGELRLVCSACGARDWEATVFSRPGEAEAWLEGAVLSSMAGGRPAF
jgi:hypothetical protein